MSAKYEKVDMNTIIEEKKLDEAISALKPIGKKMLPCARGSE